MSYLNDAPVSTATRAQQGGDAPRRTAMIVVDVQNDFVDGSLATARGAEVASLITDHLKTTSYDLVVGTKDWHIDPKGHFAAAGKEPDYVKTWPVHCVAETRGAQPHENLDVALVSAWYHKGEYTAAYSGFEAHEAKSLRSGAVTSGALLGDSLRNAGITDVVICGIATDFCVRATALDAVKNGFNVIVLRTLCAPVSETAAEGVFTELAEAGALVK